MASGLPEVTKSLRLETCRPPAAGGRTLGHIVVDSDSEMVHHDGVTGRFKFQVKFTGKLWLEVRVQSQHSLRI